MQFDHIIVLVVRALLFLKHTVWRDWDDFTLSASPDVHQDDMVFDVGGLQIALYDNVFTVKSINVSISQNDFIWSNANNFSFVPSDRTPARGCHNLGDVTFRIRPLAVGNRADGINAPGGKQAGPLIPARRILNIHTQSNQGDGDEWGFLSSALSDGSVKAKEIPPSTGELVSHDITPLIEQDTSQSLSAFGGKSPVQVERTWRRHIQENNGTENEYLILQLDITNRFHQAIEIGGLGLSMPAAGLPLINKTDIRQAVLEDPHIGLDHGYVEFVRLVDDERVMLVVPDYSCVNSNVSDAIRQNDNNEKKCISRLEGWRPLLENTCGNNVWEYTIFSKAWAAEWALSRQYPFLYMSEVLNKTQMWPNPQTPWPAWHGHESVPITDHTENGFSAPFNSPTSVIIQPGQKITSALKFILARGGPRTTMEALNEAGTVALVKAEPGYVLSPDMNSARLFIKPPIGTKLLSVFSSNSIALKPHFEIQSTSDLVRKEGDQQRDWLEVGIEPRNTFLNKNSRVRLMLKFTDGSIAAVHFVVTGETLQSQMRKMGEHLVRDAWLPRDYPDAFGRAASVMPWDRELKARILDDSRAYDVGLSDDAGSGNPLALAIKTAYDPTPQDVECVDEFVQYTLYGTKEGLLECSCQQDDGSSLPCDCAKPPFKSLQIRPQDIATGSGTDLDGIRMTMYYYDFIHIDPKNDTSPTYPSPDWSGYFNYTYSEVQKCPNPFDVIPGIEGGPNWCMAEDMANATYRGFNYPHHTASYYSLYRIARNHGNFTDILHKDWLWYLMRAANTTLQIGEAGVGLMDGTIFREVLRAINEEIAVEQDDIMIHGRIAPLEDVGKQISEHMMARARYFDSVLYPYGSEFAFDTTGQEEVVVWLLNYAGNADAGDKHNSYMASANRTVSHILSFMRSSPTWAYHGGSRSWGDVGNNGKWMTTFGTNANFETRANFHYRSGLNSIPLLEWYRRNPDDFNSNMILEIGLGAQAGTIVNIDPDTGASSMGLHMLPHIMEYDPHSGDFGLGFFGHALQSASYLVFDDQSFGGNFGAQWMCYLCNFVDGRPRHESRLEALSSTAFTVELLDSMRQRMFIEPLCLYIVLDTGKIKSVKVDFLNQGLVVVFEESRENLSFDVIRIRLEKTCELKSRPGKNFVPMGTPIDTVRGAFIFPADTSHIIIQWIN